jgi:hypothetical protein
MSRHRTRIAAAVAVLAIGAGAGWWYTTSNDESDEVCQTTVYQGCIQRWDYLFEEE